MSKFKKGDIIIYDNHVFRQILKVKEKSYLWKYPEYGDFTPNGNENIFDSRNSNDPELIHFRVATEDEVENIKTSIGRTNGHITRLKELLTIKLNAEVILNDDTVNSWGNSNVKPKYSIAEVKAAQEAFSNAVKETDEIISQL